jgi:hypothetical protein
MFTENLSQALGVVGCVIPATAATGSSFATEAIALAANRRVGFYLTLGAVATSGAAQILVQGATASAGSYTTITSLTSNVLTASGVTISEATAEQIVALNLGYTWIKGIANVTGANVSGVSMLALAGETRYHPATSQSYVASAVVF